MTSAQHAIQQIPIALRRDSITVVGASHMTMMEKLRGQKGNKMRFINQGIRQIRLYSEASDDASQHIFLIFTEDYERPLLNAVKDVVERRYKAKYQELDSIAHLLDFINSRIAEKREIKQLDLFAHGLVGTIEFGYELAKAASYRMRDTQAQMLDPEAFDLRGKIYSYACRTGLGIDADVYVSEGEDPLYEQSLAQLIANTAQTPVWAFARRSNYDQTYGSSEDRSGLAGARNRVQADANAMKVYRRQLSHYQKRLAAHRQASNNPIAALPNESSPRPPQKVASADDQALVRHANSRDEYEQSIGYPLDAEGAARPVRAGDSPTGVPARLLEFKPL
jgi:hypothetical protein